MINNIADLKNRTLVESNILKSFILSYNDGSRSPDRDDILIHDYQIANSVTINTILSNYVVNLKYAWNMIDNFYGGAIDSYFQIVEDLDQDTLEKLSDEAKLILSVGNGDGTFSTRQMEYDAEQIIPPDGTVKFINLDAVWYGLVREKIPGTEYTKDYLQIVDDMNNFNVNPNPYGVNPFTKPVTCPGGASYDSFNDFVERSTKDSSGAVQRSVQINCIVENLFYKNIIDEDEVPATQEENVFGKVIPQCRYIVCLTHGLFGLQPQIDEETREFTGFRLHDIGKLIPNLDENNYQNARYMFAFCGFHVVNNILTFVVVFREDDGSGGYKYYYAFINEDSYDRNYGLTRIKSVVVDQLLLSPEQVFQRIDSIKSLGEINIVMTDYGFWDIEPNMTNSITYSFRGKQKKYDPKVTKLSGDSTLGAIRKDKIVRPETALTLKGTDKVVEYDKIWKLSKKNGANWVASESQATHYKCDAYDYAYLTNIIGTTNATQPFVGGTSTFAVYDSVEQPGSPSGRAPVHILALMSQSQFNELLFSTPQLIMPFMKWLYDQVVYCDVNGTAPTASGVKCEYGEYYIYNRYTDIVNSLYNTIIHTTTLTDGSKARVFDKLFYQIPNNEVAGSGEDGDKILITEDFKSIYNIVRKYQSFKGLAQPTTLFSYYDTLQKMKVDDGLLLSGNLGWLLNDSDLDKNIKNYFTKADGEYAMQLPALVKGIVQQLIDKYPPLAYFQTYLTERFNKDLVSGNFDSLTIEKTEDSIKEVLKNVRNFIVGKVPACLALGNYDNSKPEINNGKYPDIGPYIYRNKINLSKFSIQDVMSITNCKNQMIAAVQSCPFFAQYPTYDELNTVKALGGLWKVNYNMQFAAINSNIVDTSGNIRVNWNDISSWLFGASQTPAQLLKWFVTTQVYRPLFFKYDDYVNFSKDTSAYWCKTDKFYVKHDGTTNPLKFTSGSWPNNPVVDVNNSHLNRAATDNYTIPSGSITYFKASNVLAYSINYDEIQLVDGKFVLDDVEFYSVVIEGKVNSLYFNEFQKETNTSGDWIDVVDGKKFMLNGIEYTIDDKGRISVEPATTAFTETSPAATQYGKLEYKCEIVDDRFKLDGIRYVLRKDSAGKYTKIEYADADDTKLVQVPITSDGYGHYDNWNLEFQFVKSGATVNWNKIQVIRKYQTKVINRIQQEWCKFQDQTVNIGPAYPNQTYDWYLSNELANVKKTYGTHEPELIALGGGHIFSGSLLNARCKLEIENQIVGGRAVSRGILRKTCEWNGEESTQDIGILFGSREELDTTKVFTGTLAANGLVTKAAAGDKTIILKDVDNGFNNCNAIWLSKSAWESCFARQAVGTIEEDEETEEIVAYIQDSVRNAPEVLMLYPIWTEKQNGTRQATSFRIRTTVDNVNSYVVNRLEDQVYLVANGDRYMVDLKTCIVYKFMFYPPSVETMDFSTQYTFEQLKQNLVTNIKQYMLNEIVQTLLDNTSTSTLTISFNPYPALGCYLEMFSDSVSFDNFGFAQKVDIAISNEDKQERDRKFNEVFKNNIKEIDDSKIYNGRPYKYLAGKIDTVFTGEAGAKVNVVPLVDCPSLDVTRTSGNVDEFTYTTYMDVHLFLNKRILQSLLTSNRSGYTGKYIIGNAVLKNVEFKVKFTPVLTSGTPGTVKYNILYSVTPKTYNVEFSQVIYHDKKKDKVKIKTISPRSATYAIPATFTYTKTGQPFAISQITNEKIASYFDQIFTVPRVKDILCGASGINNTLNAAASANVEVGYDIVKNKTATGDGGVWDLYAAIPSGVQTLTPHYLGYVVVDGLQYEVVKSGETLSLKEVGGSKTLSITSLSVWADNNLATTTSTWAAMGETLVTKSTIDSAFTLQQIYQGDATCKFMTFKGVYASKFGTISGMSSAGDFAYTDLTDAAAAAAAMGVTTLPASFRLYVKTLTDQERADMELEDWPDRVGPDLSPDTTFDFEFDLSPDASGNFSYTQDVIFQPENTGHICKPGKFRLSVSGNVGSPEAVLVSAARVDDSWDFASLLLNDRNYSTVVTRYMYNAIPSEDNVVVSIDVNQEEAEEGQEAPPPTYTMSLTFAVKLIRDVWKGYLGGGTPYVAEKLYYNGAGGFQNVIPVTDLNGRQVHTLGYGYMEYPTNLDSATSFEKLEYRNIYFTLSGTTLTSNGIYCPCTLRVIPPEDPWEREGDIYDRFYASEDIILVQYSSIPSGFSVGDTDVWMDKASTLKSLGVVETNTSWKYLINTSAASSYADQKVPQTMRDAIQEIVTRTLKLDDTYFLLMLSQFQSFLGILNNELNQTETLTWNRNDIRKLCKFGHSAIVKYKKRTNDKNRWCATDSTFTNVGLFAPDESIDPGMATYNECRDNWNNHLYNEFFNDYSALDKTTVADLAKRDYHKILLNQSGTPAASASFNGNTYHPRNAGEIARLRTDVLVELRAHLNIPLASGGSDIISQIYGNTRYVGDINPTLDATVRYLNVIGTSLFGPIRGMYVIDGNCHLFVDESEQIMWYTFDTSSDNMNLLLENKRNSAGDYTYTPLLQQKEFQINGDRDWILRFANRDLSTTNTLQILDAYMVRSKSASEHDIDLWYLSYLDTYLYCQNPVEILDVAYEQYYDSLYVMFKGDCNVYRFDNVLQYRDSQNKILLKKEVATMKIETFHSVSLSANEMAYHYLYIDYENPDSDDPIREKKDWKIALYGTVKYLPPVAGGDEELYLDREEWNDRPGNHVKDYLQYNIIFFGDSLFNEDQLKFQNISKNKDMFDILDIGEVDGCYYGLFKDETLDADGRPKSEVYGHEIYTVFKTAPKNEEENGAGYSGVVQRLPYEVVVPSLYTSADSLYSLFVAVYGTDGRLQLREISVPDADVYAYKTIELQKILEESDKISVFNDLDINQIILNKFVMNSMNSQFFVLSNKGFHRIFYRNKIKNVSIDRLPDFQEALKESLTSTVLKSHMEQKHRDGDYFDVIARKINQFDEGTATRPAFDVFQLIPTEFKETQDIGVIPDSKVDDTDESKDHRPDSVQVSTDILMTDGMVAQKDTNPGLVTAAVSNPATTYDSEYVFLKSQRNPSIVGSEFYDYITDTEGNVLMDLYEIPYIYVVNSNNTYDLYINIPTTRTKYLNRIAGTLKPDLTSFVQAGDTRTRRNFLDEVMPNNLDESTTKLRIYIDKKYISIGNVEQVEISGNSIPLQIYRDVPNKGFYDSIALESRWDGEVNEISDQSQDIYKVMLEFECYGTDSQSIHIQGKTLIHRALDDKKYQISQ